MSNDGREKIIEKKSHQENTLSIGIDFDTKKTICAIWNKSKKKSEIIKDPVTKQLKFPSVLNFSSEIQYLDNKEEEKSFTKKKK